MKKGFPDLIFLDTIFPVAVGKYPPQKSSFNWERVYLAFNSRLQSIIVGRSKQAREAVTRWISWTERENECTHAYDLDHCFLYCPVQISNPGSKHRNGVAHISPTSVYRFPLWEYQPKYSLGSVSCFWSWCFSTATEKWVTHRPPSPLRCALPKAGAPYSYLFISSLLDRVWGIMPAPWTFDE